MNALQRKKLARALKTFESEGLVFRSIPDYEKQKRVAIRFLRRRVKQLDKSASFFFEAHFNRQNHHFDSDVSREFFGRIMQARGGLTNKINVLVGHGHAEADYDSP